MKWSDVSEIALRGDIRGMETRPKNIHLFVRVADIIVPTVRATNRRRAQSVEVIDSAFVPVGYSRAANLPSNYCAKTPDDGRFGDDVSGAV
jgi:hypothetical protein